MNFDAFKDAPWFDSSYRVTIGGLGNIGSWTSILMARMGYVLYLFDYDIVEARNVGSQFYSSADIGMRKDQAMRKRLIDLTGNRQMNLFGRFDEGSPADNIMISCFDNMTARRFMFNKWLNYQVSKKDKNPNEVNIFIDGRSNAETGQVYTVKSRSEAKQYQEEFFSDDDPEVEIQECSYKSTAHNGAMISSMIMTLLANHIANKKEGIKYRDVPYKVEYELPLLSFRQR